MNLNFHTYPEDEYKKIRLEKQNINIDGKPFSDFFAIKKNMDIIPGTDKRYPKKFLLSNMHTLNDHMRLEITLKQIKKMAEMLSNDNNEYKTTNYILFYNKLKSFYTLLTVFILQLTHIFYWDEFEFIGKFIRSKKSGIDLQRSLKMAMKIAVAIKPSFESVLYEEFKIDPMLNNLFKSGIFPESDDTFKLNQYEKQFPNEKATKETIRIKKANQNIQKSLPILI
jgi:hypothetical protein